MKYTTDKRYFIFIYFVFFLAIDRLAKYKCLAFYLPYYSFHFTWQITGQPYFLIQLLQYGICDFSRSTSHVFRLVKAHMQCEHIFIFTHHIFTIIIIWCCLRLFDLESFVWQTPQRYFFLPHFSTFFFPSRAYFDFASLKIDTCVNAGRRRTRFAVIASLVPSPNATCRHPGSWDRTMCSNKYGVCWFFSSFNGVPGMGRG